MLYISFIVLSIIIFLILNALEFKKLKNKFFEKVNKNQFEKIIRKYLKKRSFFKKVFDNIEGTILKSNIKNYIPFFDVHIFIILSFIVFISLLFAFKDLGILPAAVFSTVSVYTFYALLLFLGLINRKKIKKIYLNFLSVFSGFYNVSENIIMSLKFTADYVEEPIKSIIKRNVNIYERTLISEEDCLEGILKEVGDKEFRKFIKFSKLYSKYGGNYNRALDKLSEQARRLAEVESLKSSGAIVGTTIVILMIILDIIAVISAVNDPDIINILKNTVSGQITVISNAAALIFALYIIKSINSD